MYKLRLLAPQAFTSKFDRAIGAQRAVQHALQDLATRFRSAGPQAYASYDTWAGFEPAAKRAGLDRVIEIKAGGSLRLLAGASGSSLHLLDFGDHDVEKQWDHIKNKGNWLEARLSNSQTATGLIRAGSANPFISLRECEGWSHHFFGEDTSEWVAFLDTEQYGVATQITEEIEDHLLGDRAMDSIWLVLGGPGTGKTAVLFKILQKLVGERFHVGFQSSDEVYDYLQTVSTLR